MRPLTYWDNRGTILGHYSAGVVSGTLAATIGAAGHLSSLRWAPTTLTAYLALMKLRVGLTVITAITTAVQMGFQAVIARGFSVDFTTASTAASMSGVANTQKMRAGMGTSLLGTVGPRISTTTVMSGQTLTADAFPFAMCTVKNPSDTLGASAVTNQVGAGIPMTTLYEWNALGAHPPVLSNNEGILVQPIKAMNADGATVLYVEYTWAEILAF